MPNCIPLFRPGSDVTAEVTTGTVTGKQFVTITEGLNAAEGKLLGVATAGAGDAVLGVAATDGRMTYDSERAKVPVIVGPGHVVPVVAGGAIEAGDEVEAGADGVAVAASTGTAVGRAWSDAAEAGDEVFVELY